jgi:hypothetical protein
VAELFPSAFPSGQGSDLADHHDPVTTNHLPGCKPESAAKISAARLRRVSLRAASNSWTHRRYLFCRENDAIANLRFR